MTKEEYVKTLEINGVKVDIGVDDYGQCYFYEYDLDGHHYEQGCGTYNLDFASQLYYELDPVYKSLFKKWLNDELTDEEEKQYNSYQLIIDKANKL